MLVRLATAVLSHRSFLQSFLPTTSKFTLACLHLRSLAILGRPRSKRGKNRRAPIRYFSRDCRSSNARDSFLSFSNLTCITVHGQSMIVSRGRFLGERDYSQLQRNRLVRLDSLRQRCRNFAGAGKHEGKRETRAIDRRLPRRGAPSCV